jgi:hypothetical protein
MMLPDRVISKSFVQRKQGESTVRRELMLTVALIIGFAGRIVVIPAPGTTMCWSIVSASCDGTQSVSIGVPTPNVGTRSCHDPKVAHHVIL